MTMPVDMELKKAFGELQSKMVETSKKIQYIDGQISLLKRGLQHIDITQQEMVALKADTKTYEAIGRMFLHTELGVVKKNLNKRATQLGDRAKELEKNKFYLEMNLKESEDNLREMVQQRKVQTEKSS